MKRLATLIVSILMLITPWNIQGQNTNNLPSTAQTESFFSSRGLYRTPGEKRWRRATISIEPDKIEVHHKGKELVASFESAEVAFEMKGFNLSKPAAIVSGVGNGILAAQLIYIATQDDLKVDIKKAAIFLGVVNGISLAIGLSKTKHPYAQINDGMRSIEIRARKKHASRFESALATFKAHLTRDHP